MTLDTRTAQTIADKFHALGLTKKLPAEVGTLLDRAEQLNEQAHQQHDASFSAVRNRIVTALATGQTTAAKARDELVKAHTSSDTGNLTQQALLDAAKRAGAMAGKHIEDMGERLVTDLLAPLGEQVITKATQQLEAVGTATTADEAMRAGRKVADAWISLAEQEDTWDQIVDLLRTLRRTSVIAGNQFDDYLWFAEPAGIRDEPLGKAIRLGRRPRILTEAQAREEATATQEAEKARRQAEQAKAPKSGPRSITSMVTGHRMVDESTMQRMVAQVESKGAEPVPAAVAKERGLPAGLVLKGGTDPDSGVPANLQAIADSIPRR